MRVDAGRAPQRADLDCAPTSSGPRVAVQRFVGESGRRGGGGRSRGRPSGQCERRGWSRGDPSGLCQGRGPSAVTPRGYAGTAPERGRRGLGGNSRGTGPWRAASWPRAFGGDACRRAPGEGGSPGPGGAPQLSDGAGARATGHRCTAQGTPVADLQAAAWLFALRVARPPRNRVFCFCSIQRVVLRGGAAR